MAGRRFAATEKVLGSQAELGAGLIDDVTWSPCRAQWSPPDVGVGGKPA